jgi:hypothetical protein
MEKRVRVNAIAGSPATSRAGADTMPRRSGMYTVVALYRIVGTRLSSRNTRRNYIESGGGRNRDGRTTFGVYGSADSVADTSRE